MRFFLLKMNNKILRFHPNGVSRRCFALYSNLADRKKADEAITKLRKRSTLEDQRRGSFKSFAGLNSKLLSGVPWEAGPCVSFAEPKLW